jgi:hypothetical protein
VQGWHLAPKETLMTMAHGGITHALVVHAERGSHLVENSGVGRHWKSLIRIRTAITEHSFDSALFKNIRAKLRQFRDARRPEEVSGFAGIQG